MNGTKWQRVSRRRVCPICERPDWCVYAGPDDAPTAVLCARTESAKRCGDAGWLHVLRDDGPAWPPWRRTITKAVKMMADAQPNGSDRLAAEAAAAVAWCDDHAGSLERFAANLGLSPEGLRRLYVGYLPNRRAWAFPMRNASGEITGIRLRLSNARKLSVKGGKEGLFIPEGLQPGGRLLIAEGPTDTAALLDLGFAAVGRPSCSGGVKHLAELARRLRPDEIVIVADGDGPGQRGAETLADKLAAYVPAVRIVTPPAGVKDAREWKRNGATRADVRAAIDPAPIRRLTVTTTTRRRKAGARHGS